MPFAAPEPPAGRLPVRDPESPRRVTLLELFFDLVYVVALSLISRGMITDLSWERAFQSLIILMAMWWTWAITTLVTDMYDPQRPQIKVLIVAVMFGALLMTTAIPEAFAARGLVFAGTYVAIHIGRGLYLMPAVRRHRQTQRRAARIFVWFAVSSVPWLVGGALAHGHAREWLWTLALAIDYLGFRLAYPVPGLGVVPDAQRNVTAEHLSERYQQFFIIALGDAILVTGTVFSLHHSEVENIGAFTIAFGTTLLLWRIYVHKSGELLPHAIARSKQPNRFLNTAPYTHLLLVAGVVTSAAGFDLVLLHPIGHTPPAWLAVILGGPAMFLAGRAAFEYEVFSRVSLSRPGGLLALLTIAPAGLFLAPIYTALGAMLVLAGVAIADHLRSRGRPPEEPAPPH
ncbi:MULTISPECIES: low temperature requirement protein A [Micromonospora]|uniref:Low temperature requirement protein A n=1 Tax=Micromonospora solifontis TaxID=2487138 RepID=A0ABX9WC83_9ACTN|nr:MULTISPECIES: low temperature requirement protein A [Micromonospora]NES13044.1 low temperature requirement protein A [Micromonospora sp. PPF5-17B]NES38306.1 low temperature requirement protein A [Micromonospora solifontis]NES54969.1 low temperature requirement protein A [Micromonospora sp. PPF5-6]RNL96320.1 low temperature requirement protein A [Micromonospora solifontis]